MKSLSLIAVTIVALATPARAGVVPTLIPAYDGVNEPKGCVGTIGNAFRDWFSCEGEEAQIVPPNCEVIKGALNGDATKFQIVCNRPYVPRPIPRPAYNGTAPAESCKLTSADQGKVYYVCAGADLDEEHKVPRTCDLQTTQLSSDTDAVLVCPDLSGTLSDADVALLPLEEPTLRVDGGSSCGSPIADPGNPNVQYHRCSGNIEAYPDDCTTIPAKAESEFFIKCPTDRVRD